MRYARRAAYYLSLMMKSEIQTANINGAVISSCRSVFNPFISRSSKQFANWVAKNSLGKSILDIGTGTGVLGIVAAVNGATYVTMTDCNEMAISCAKSNILNNNMDCIAHVKKCNSAGAITGTYDLILFAAPYLWFAPPLALLQKHSDLTLSMFDENDRAKFDLLEYAQGLLSAKGRLAIQIGSMSRIVRIERRAREQGFSVIERIEEREGREKNILLIFQSLNPRP